VLEASGAAAESADVAEEVECGICYEAIPLTGIAKLPCSCRVPYCHSCWDRALAASMSSCGRATCPSCRMALRVDFDAALGRLFFSRAETNSAGCTGIDTPNNANEDDDWFVRLYAQAKPAQIKLLQEYSAGVRDAERSCAGVQVPNSARGQHQGPRQQLPRCVCGSQLVCLTVEQRVLMYAEEEGVTNQRRLERMLKRPPIICDLCNRDVSPDGSIWSCENGSSTVMHPASYDICSRCFTLCTTGHSRDEDIAAVARDLPDSSNTVVLV